MIWIVNQRRLPLNFWWYMVIKFLTKEKNGQKIIHERIVAPSSFEVKPCTTFFRWVRESIDNNPKLEQLVETRTEMSKIRTGISAFQFIRYCK